MYAVVAAVARRSGSGDGGGGSTCCASAMVGIRRAPSMHPKSSSCVVLIAWVVHVGLLPQLWAGWLAAWYPGHVYGRGKHPKEAPWAPWLKKKGENFELFAIFAAWAQNFTKSRFFSAQECPTP